MHNQESPKVLALSTTLSGQDAVKELLRKGYNIVAVIGLHPEKADPISISDYSDVTHVSKTHGVAHHYVYDYSLEDARDRQTISGINFDLVWVSGWQRLIPAWLIEAGRLGAIGCHGSPDGIEGGRGRSPQNWALMLGCKQFDLFLFRLTPGVDDGPVLCSRTFHYTEYDDIVVSHHRVAMAAAEMMAEVLDNPAIIHQAKPQTAEGSYFPQRKPDDGRVDWTMKAQDIAAHCRALTKPYPGLKTREGNTEIILWESIPFDHCPDDDPGIIGFCFGNGDFLVNCGDGRVLIRIWSANTSTWKPKRGMSLKQFSFANQIQNIIDRHHKKKPSQKVNQRVIDIIKT